MPLKLDKTDRKILLMLKENCRYPNSFIAKQLKISEQLVKYRISKLEDSGLIKKYIITTMRNSIGVIRYYMAYLKIRNTKTIEKKLIINYLKSQDIIIRLFECDGLWNVCFEINSALQLDIIPLLDEIQTLANGNIEDLKIFTVSYEDYLGRNPILEGSFDFEKYDTKNTSFQKELYQNLNKCFHGIARLDKIDISLLSVLRNQARMPISRISEKLGCSTDTVKSRIKLLINRGIIRGFTIYVDYSIIGYFKGKILLSALTNKDKAKEIISYIGHNFPEVETVFMHLDYWNLGFTIYYNNPDRMDYIMDEILLNFNDIIMDYTKLRILNILKYEPFNEDLMDMYNKAVNLLELK